jgi:U3 small nucleolar RNA-associated protein 11
MSTKRILNPRSHPERSQPAKRNHLGCLEKHKDNVRRASNFQMKRDRLKRMKQKAQLKNPDEFYFKMISQKDKKVKAASGQCV